MTSVPGRYHVPHIKPQGPGDGRPTALDIITDERLANKLLGFSAVVTGTSNGLGIQTIRALHAAGMTIYATARNAEKLDRVLQDIRDNEVLSSQKSDPTTPTASFGGGGQLGPRPELIPIIIDQESLASVRQGAQQILDHSKGKLNLLVCNAGVMATPQGKTEDGFEMQFGVNHVAHFLLFALLKDALVAGSTPERPSRVVTVSSIGHQLSPVRIGRYINADGSVSHTPVAGADAAKQDYNFTRTTYHPWLSYGQTKTANIWMASEIERRFGHGHHAIRGISLHPGGINTGLSKHMSEEEQQKWNTDQIRLYMKSPEQGAATTVYAAVSADFLELGKAMGRPVGPQHHCIWLSNCGLFGEFGHVQGTLDESGFNVGDDGYNPWALDTEGAKILWKDSCKLVGVDEF